MEVHVSTQYTYRKYRQFYLFSKFRGKHYKLWRNILYAFLILGLVFLILFIRSYVLNPTESRFIPFLYYPTYFLIIISRFIPPILAYKTQKKIRALSDDYTFYKDEFRVVTNHPQFSNTKIIKYNFLEKAYETDKTFYLYLTKQTAFPIWKDGISPNEIDALRTCLISHLEADKFIMCK